MKVLENWDKISEDGTIAPLPIGAYVVRITKVIDNPEKESLEIYFDIEEGQYKDYFKTTQETFGGSDKSRSYRSYRPKAAYFFKKFIASVEKSNTGFKWDWDEKKLVGKLVSAVFGEEEFVKYDPNANTVEIKTAIKVQDWRSVQALKENRIEIPQKKLLSETDKARYEQLKQQCEGTTIDDKDLPF